MLSADVIASDNLQCALIRKSLQQERASENEGKAKKNQGIFNRKKHSLLLSLHIDDGEFC